jgi:ligand-binding sensor domain-containing protein
MYLVPDARGSMLAGTYAGLFRSVDNGANWTSVDGMPADAPILSLVVDASGQLFAGSVEGRLFRSADNGVSWGAVRAVISAPNRADDRPMDNFERLAVGAGGRLFAGLGFGGVYRSTDNGDTWTPHPDWWNAYSPMLLSLAANAQGHLFVGTDGQGIWRSINNGDTWTTINAGVRDAYVGHFAAN